MLDIGLEVKILRERLKISAKELAERIGLSQSQMSRLEKGQRRIDTRILAKISDALDVDPSYFFRGEEPPGEPIPPVDRGVGSEVRSARRRLHLSADELAHRVGSTKAKILAIEEGKLDLEPEVADRVARALKLPRHYFLDRQKETIGRLEAQVTRLQQALAEATRGPAVPGTGERGVPVLGSLAVGYPQTFDDFGEPTAETDEFLHVPGLSEAQHAFAMHVVGGSMESAMAPSFREGDLVVFARGAIRSRNFAFVRLANAPATFRQVFYDPGGRVRLQPRDIDLPPTTHGRDEVLGMWRLIAHVVRH